MLKRYFTPILVNTHAKTAVKSLLRKMAKTKKTPYRKVRPDDGVRPGTSRDTAEREGAKKLEKEGEHSQWISFLNDFNMQYIQMKFSMK